MDEYKKFAEKFALQAGVLMRKNFTLGMKKEWKSDNSPVTQTDILINELLIEKIHEQFPTHNILAEEKSDLKNTTEYVWVCDPVDGTLPFSHGIPVSTFSLALVKDGQSILGVVYDPFLQRLFSAEKGKGAYLNNRRIQVSNAREFKGHAGGYEMGAQGHFDTAALLPHLGRQWGLKTVKLCSFIYSSMLVAAGEFVCSIYSSTAVHDVATTKIIVEEAGGRVTDLFGEDQRYDQPVRGLIASNGILHDELVLLSRKIVNPVGVL